MSKEYPIQIIISGPGGTFCFEAEIVKRALRAEGVNVEVQTNCDVDMTEEDMEEHRRRMRGDWSGGVEEKKGECDDLGAVDRYVVITEDHQPWGG